MKRGFSQILVVAVVVGILVAAGAAFIYFQLKPKTQPQPQTIQTPPQAKQTPASTTAISSPSPDKTADWNIYRNEEHRFEVRYPGDLSIQVATSRDKSSVTLYLIDKSQYLNDKSQVLGSVKVDTRPTDKVSVKEFGSLKNTDYVKLGPYEALLFRSDAPDFYLLIHNGKEYTLLASGNIPADQILTTFKFLN